MDEKKLDLAKKQSQMKWYWTIWLIAVVAVLIVFIVAFRDAPLIRRFYLFIGYAVPTYIVLITLNFIEVKRLKKFQKDQDAKEKAEKESPSTADKIILDKSADVMLVEYQEYYKKLMIFAMTVLFSAPVILIIMLFA